MNPANAFFTQCAAPAAAFVRTAEQSLRIAVCWFTHPGLFQLVHQRVQAGIKTALILNYDQVNFKAHGLDFFALEKAGAEVLGFSGPELLHYKFAVADERRVLSGSFNWTKAEHLDHVVWQEAPALAQIFTTEFERLKTCCVPLAALRNTPARAITFQQLHRPVWCTPADIRRRIIAGAKVWTTALSSKKTGFWAHYISDQNHTLHAKGILRNYWEKHRNWDEPAFRAWMADNAHVRGLRTAVSYCIKLRTGDILVAVQPPDRLLGAGIVGSEPEPSSRYPGETSRYVSWLSLPDGTTYPDPGLTRSGRHLRRYAGSGLRLAEELRQIIGEE